MGVKATREMQGLVLVLLVGLDVKRASLDCESSMSADCPIGQIGQTSTRSQQLKQCCAGCSSIPHTSGHLALPSSSNS